MKIKICGITRFEDAEYSESCGAWAIGYIFYKKSQRYIKSVKAGKISAKLNCEKIGVFVNSSVDRIRITSKKSGITKIQLHGDEDVEFIKALRLETNLPIIKAIRVASPQDIAKAKEFEEVADMILFDTYSKNEYGGTGESFDWKLLDKAQLNIPTILSGGINIDNLNQALATESYALDISSGVEISKGEKEKDKIKQIFDALSASKFTN